jgi:hypothetical protein
MKHELSVRFIPRGREVLISDMIALNEQYLWVDSVSPMSMELDKAVGQSGPVLGAYKGCHRPVTFRNMGQRSMLLRAWRVAQGREEARNFAMTLTFCVVSDLGRNVGPYCDGRNTQATREPTRMPKGHAGGGVRELLQDVVDVLVFEIIS